MVKSGEIEAGVRPQSGIKAESRGVVPRQMPLKVLRIHGSDLGIWSGPNSDQQYSAMGLRKLFRGLHPSDRREPSTSPSPSPSLLAAGTTNTDAITPMTSSHSSPDANVTTEHSTPRDLWDEAYIILSREDPKLKERYEEILSTQDEINGEPSHNHLGGLLSILSRNPRSDATVI